MSLCCPKCNSTRLGRRFVGRRTVASIGTIAGSLSGAVGALRGAQVGMSLGIIGGPPTMTIGALAGAALGAMVGGAFGCKIGADLGELVDQDVLNDCECLDCGFSFNKQSLLCTKPTRRPDDEPDLQQPLFPE